MLLKREMGNEKWKMENENGEQETEKGEIEFFDMLTLDVTLSCFLISLPETKKLVKSILTNL